MAELGRLVVITPIWGSAPEVLADTVDSVQPEELLRRVVAQIRPLLAPALREDVHTSLRVGEPVEALYSCLAELSVRKIPVPPALPTHIHQLLAEPDCFDEENLADMREFAAAIGILECPAPE